MTKLRHTLRSASDLVEAGIVSEMRESEVARVAERYAVAITPTMAELVDPADAADPIARQFVPDERELDHAAYELADPIGDFGNSPVRGLVHRYADRVLLKLVGVCPVYCRFCFRREMVGPAAEANLNQAEIDAALAYIRARPEIWEVILTGGDPFILSPRRVAETTAALDGICHVKIIRWHTRVPVVAPERITSDLVAALKPERATVYVALHINHPRELTQRGREAIARLADSGIPLLSQTVLLRGVNDDVETLEALMRALVEVRIKPYYLHHGDLAPGTGHFRTSIAEGRALVHALRRRLSGLAMPTYVLDIPGGYGKVPAGQAYITGDSDAALSVEDSGGVAHTYMRGCGPG